jgi:hypothetical protein
MLLGGAIGLSESPASAATVGNGGFETGDLGSWTVVDQPGSGGSWFNYTGTNSPVSGSTIAAPPQGTRGATSDMSSPGSHVLYQDIILESGATHTLSLTLYYRNYAPDFATPATLDFSSGTNQQYRVDIMRTAAATDSVAPGDVLASVFQTRAGDPSTMAPTPMTIDLTPFGGQTVRLRFAQVDNQAVFTAGVDAVSITSQGATTLANNASAGTTVGGTVTDSVVLTSPFVLTGTVTFTLFGPDNATCTGTPVFTSVRSVPATGSVTSEAFAPATAGTYRWVASYSGDGTSAPAASACGAPNSTVVLSAAAAPAGQPAAAVVAQPAFTG